jgi:replicative DNA helicase
MDLVDSPDRKVGAVDKHRSLPFSEDAEKGVICSLLLSPREILDTCQLKISQETFYIPAHRIVYSTVSALLDANKPVDFISVKQSLKDANLLDEIGGPECLSSLFAFVPTAANADYYIDIIREKHILRQIIATCGRVTAQCYDGPEEIDALVDEVEQQIFSITNQSVQIEVRPTKQLVIEAVEEIERLYENRGAVTGIPTGFIELDRITNGLHPSEMIVIAARPSMGKTAFAMNIAEHVSINSGKAVAIFSLEMSSHQLVQRLLCARAKVDLQRVRDGFLADRDFRSLTTAAATLAGAKMFIDDTAGLSIIELRAKARRLKAQHDIQLIVIDYLQLLRGSSRRSQENRQLEISEISAGVKALAKELSIPIIVVAQLNRQPELRGGGKPRLSDLRESGSIEQDADLVGLLVRPEYYETDDEAKQELSGVAELIIAKQRNGPTGEVPLTFLKQFTRFENRTRQQMECITPVSGMLGRPIDLAVGKAGCASQRNVDNKLEGEE